MTELPFVPYGHPTSPFCGLVILGEAPGAEEVRRSRPFCGRSGKLLSDALTASGIDRTACLVANVFRFRPPENKVRHFFQTTKEAALSGNSRAADYGRHAHGFCRAEYLSEIEHLAATLRFASAVLALGAVPLWITTGRQSVTENAGLSLPCRLADLPVFPTYHPAFILRGNRGLIPEWQAAMHRAARFAELTHRQPERIEP